MTIKKWWQSGTPWVWMNAAAVAASIIMVVGILGLIGVRGLGHFWPSSVQQIEYRQADNSLVTYAGIPQEQETIAGSLVTDSRFSGVDSEQVIGRELFKLGNRDVTGVDFKWFWSDLIESRSYPEDIYVLERFEWGGFIGYVHALNMGDQTITDVEAIHTMLPQLLEESESLRAQVKSIEVHDIGSVNYSMEKIRLQRKRYEIDEIDDPSLYEKLEQEKLDLDKQYVEHFEALGLLRQQLSKNSLVMKTASGDETTIPLSMIVQMYRPNRMNALEKFSLYLHNFKEFIFGAPREANTEGGVFPAIFGTVTMVIIMSIFVTPFGVIAAVYLREYAKQGKLTGTIRIAVNNLAGVPSIVYGVFGLGFFVYFLGGNIDALFYPESSPAPVFGTPGLLWASITLALLTVPVVIVATEEGLARIPKSVREGSLALGATKFETLYKVVIPMASPAMMTGLILAVARAAGEVAPLMLVGVVKLAPTLPIDGNFPFIHLERQFMHLGFHIYDVGFQSPNIDAARPLVYATAFLLVAVIASLNLTAIYIRNRLRERYRSLETY